MYVIVMCMDDSICVLLCVPRRSLRAVLLLNKSTVVILTSCTYGHVYILYLFYYTVKFQLMLMCNLELDYII